MNRIIKYLNQKKEIYTCLLSYIDKDEDEDFTYLASLLKNLNQNELKEFFHLILILCNNHHRNPNFFTKIDQILLYLKHILIQFFSNEEIFEFFKSNKRILLFLIQNNILNPDETIFDLMLPDNNNKDFSFLHYFYPEIEPFIKSSEKMEISTRKFEYDPSNDSIFNKNRLKGENDSLICKLIRHDSISEFVQFINKIIISVNSIVPHSIFETNSLLLEKPPTLIEYSAFFGSNEIFQFLKVNKAELNPSLWLYAIHGANSDIIHSLEDFHLKPEDESYFKCFEESIKDHQNEIADYIQNNLLKKAEFFNRNYNSNGFFENTPLSYYFHYFNYHFFDDKMQYRYLLHYAAKFGHIEIVQLILNSEDIYSADMILIKN